MKRKESEIVVHKVEGGYSVWKGDEELSKVYEEKKQAERRAVEIKVFRGEK